MTDVAYVTIATNSHIGYAMTLAQSLRDAVPQARLKVYVVDGCRPSILPETDIIEFFDAETIGIEGFDDMARRYSAFELSAALKAPCILDALTKRGAEIVIYLDSDTFILQPLTEATSAIADGNDCVLTPHITRPTVPGEVLPDRSYLTAGVFNLGFAAFSNRPPAIEFLRWWAGRKRESCIVDTSQGMLGDQTYCNLAPAFIDKLKVLRHPGYNVAHWNLDQRDITFNAEGIALSNGELVKLAHFSGFDIRAPHIVSRHRPGLTRNAGSGFIRLFDRYAASVAVHDAIHPGGFSSIGFGFAEPEADPANAEAGIPSAKQRPPRHKLVALKLRRFLAKRRGEEA